MKKTFEEFEKEGIVIKISIDKERSLFLIKEAERDYSFLHKTIDKIGIDNETANNQVKLCYDVFMELIRAKLFLEGYKATGQGAHEAEVAYLKILNFNEDDIKFADKIRYFRNGMVYYGTVLDKTYAEKVIEFTKKIYEQLKGILVK